MRKILFILGLLSCIVINAQSRKKDYTNIIKSTNIYEINAFLRDAHPNDPRRNVLKTKVMGMMDEYIKNAMPFDQRVPQMQEMLALLKRGPSTKVSYEEFSAKIREKKLAKLREELEVAGKMTEEEAKNAYKKYSEGNSGKAAIEAAAVAGISNYVNPEEEEFNQLISLSPAAHKDKTVKILNTLFNNDPNSNDVIVMVENKSDCNIIVRIEGAGNKNYRLPVPAKKENSMVVEKGSYLLTSLVCGALYASQKKIYKPLIVNLANPGALKK